MKTLIFFISLLVCSVFAIAQPVSINNFQVKEHLLKNNKLAVIATDSLEHPLETVNGTFQFSINGFTQQLKFNDGIAVSPQPIEKSTFVYLKHENESGTHSKLYYIIKRDNNLNPIKINWMLLLIIPLIIIAIATIFRKFILFAIILLVVIFF